MIINKHFAAALVLSSASMACFAQVDDFQKNIPAPDVKAMQDGRSLRVKGRFTDALAKLRPLAQKQPDYFNAQYELGLALTSRDETLDEGIGVLKKAAELKRAHPEVTDAHVFNSLGWAYMSSGRPKEAEKAFKEAESNVAQLSDDTRKRLYNNMGSLYLTQGKLKDSEKYLTLAAQNGSQPAQANLRTLNYMKKQPVRKD